VRSDNGEEYVTGVVKNLCVNEGIRRKLIAPHNPQQNRVAERKNHSIVGAAKAMLHDQGLSMFLCVEACNTIVFLQNKCPHKVIGRVTPKEAFTGKKHDVSHFRIFGTKVFCHKIVGRIRSPQQKRAFSWDIVRQLKHTGCIYQDSRRRLSGGM